MIYNTTANAVQINFIFLKVLHQIISASLKEAHETNDIHSITFPALGRGFNNFPAQTVAKVMFKCVADFEENLGSEPTVKDVRFVIYPADEEAIEVWSCS